jgi:methyl-accepting chemotaxis protein
LQTYRRLRNDMLALAQSEQFDQVRIHVPQRVRPAYDLVKSSLSQLGPPAPLARRPLAGLVARLPR